MADRAERLAEGFARCNLFLDRARSAVLEMVKLRDELSPLRVHLRIEGVATTNHPYQVGAPCEANEKTLRRIAALMRAGDLRTARAEFTVRSTLAESE